MTVATVDFSKDAGAMRPMHAVNNGPQHKYSAGQRISNLAAFREAGIPYARTHDASINYYYGGDHTVDVNAVFPDFDADESDPASYDFVLTDEYMRVIFAAGTKPFYRLGCKIEHWPKKYGTLPPPDFHKWARICEHIIRHYTEGWADGFAYDMVYWEIWNEPDCPDDLDPVKKTCWGGTKAQFFELYAITAKHLKSCFPHLKIGGPAVGTPAHDWSRDFLVHCKENALPLDFFSWHIYAKTPQEVVEMERYTHAMLEEVGLTETESVLNEWNYVRGWDDEEWIYSLRTEKGLKGASFTAAVMSASQYEAVDLLMYYDARPCIMNGLFDTDFVCDKLKGYYPFPMFSTLYRLGRAVPFAANDAEIFGCAAKGEDGMAVMLTRYADEEAAEEKSLCLNLAGLPGVPVKITCSVLDGAHDLVPVHTELVTGREASLRLSLPLFTSYLLTVERNS